MSASFTDWEGTCLVHHGIKGQKWGVRRFQNSDGTLTSAGKAHYGQIEGGSRKLGSQYNKQLRKLNRLQKRSDINQQLSNIQKYDKRARKALNVGNAAAAVAGATGLGSIGLNKLSKMFDDRIVNSKTHSEIDRLRDVEAQYWKQHESDARKFGSGDISKREYKARTDVIDSNRDIQRRKIKDEEYKSRVSNANKRDATDIARDVARYTSYAAAGAAAVSYGVAAYSKIQSRIAKKRITSSGHKKAVAKYKAQYAKMTEMFSNTPYSELINNQQRASQNQIVKNENRKKRR